MDIAKMHAKLEKTLTKNRLAHSVNVMETAVKMAEYYGADNQKARVAGLLHDCAKNYSKDELITLCDKYSIKLDEILKQQHGLIHGFLGAEIAKHEFGIDDEEIYDAIYYHTVGKPDMPLLTKIIYIADFIEPARDFDGVETLRKLAYQNLDKAIVFQTDSTIKSVLRKGALLHPATINTRNFYISR